MKCVTCSQRKGKRSCPAKGSMICPTCCGLKRVVEIDCPSDCPYLAIGMEYRVVSQSDKLLRSLDHFKQLRHSRTVSRFEGFLKELEYIIVKEYRSLRELKDADILEAVSLLLKSYETEEKGIIYPYRSFGRVDILVKTLQQLIEKHRKPLLEHHDHEQLSLRDIIDCLYVTRENIEFHIGEKISPTGYLDFKLQLFPEINQAEQHRIIIP